MASLITASIMSKCRSTAEQEKIQRMQSAVLVLLNGLGEDVEREGLLDTPKRVAKALLEASQGYQLDSIRGLLGTALFHEPIVNAGNGGMVVVRDINFASTAEDTLLPFHGRAHVAYAPRHGVVLGLSKMARVTRRLSKRVQTQAQLGCDIAAALQAHLDCDGVAVVLQASHMGHSGPCVEQRTTACVGGSFREEGMHQLQELCEVLGLASEIPSDSVRCIDDGSSSTIAGALSRILHANSSTSSSATTATTTSRYEHSTGNCGLVSSSMVMTLQSLGPSSGSTDSLEDVMMCSSVAGPRTPDASEKDTDGESEDMTVEREVVGVEAMESAVQLLLLLMGESPSRPGLQKSAQKYVSTLLASTAGYHQRLPHPDCGAVPHDSSPPLQPTTPVDKTPHHSSTQQPQQQPSPSSSSSKSDSSTSCPTAGCGSSESPQATNSRTSCYRMSASAPGQQHTGDETLVKSVSSCRIEGSHQHATAAECASMPHWRCDAPVSSDPDSGLNSSSAPSEAAIHHLAFPFMSQCEHHMLPFYGSLTVAVTAAAAAAEQPNGQSSESGAGYSHAAAARPAVTALAVQRLVSMFSQRLQVQERITHQVADALEALGSGRDQGGCMVVCDACHMCMVSRGVENHAGRTTTLAVRGAFAEQPQLRRRVLQLCRPRLAAAASSSSSMC